MVRLETVLESMRTIRADTAQAVEEFPAAELDFRPAPDLMSFREIARHILEAGHGLSRLLLDGCDDFTAPDFRERVRGYTRLPADADRTALAAELRGAMEGDLAELAARPPEFFAGIVVRFDGQRMTRLEMLQFIKEHELTHRAQLFLYLRLKGLVPVTTRRRQARQAAKS